MQLSAGQYHTCARTAGGGYSWGNNVHGETATGSGTAPRVPTLVRGGLTWRSIAAGQEHSCGAATGGAAYCSGREVSGELGNGTTRQETVHAPVAVAPPQSSDTPPTARLVVVGCINLSCTFNGTLSFDDVGIVSHAWTFSDGTTATGAIVNHDFPVSGTYTVTLTVTDTIGQTGSARTSVTVSF